MLQLFSLPKVWIQTLNGPKSSVKWSLKIWDFLQTGIQLVIGFLDLFKGSLGQNSEASARADGWTHRELRLWLPLWFSSMTVSLIYLSSLMLSILFLCFLSITMSIAKFIIRFEDVTLLRIIVIFMWFDFSYNNCSLLI